MYLVCSNPFTWWRLRTDAQYPPRQAETVNMTLQLRRRNRRTQRLLPYWLLNSLSLSFTRTPYFFFSILLFLASSLFFPSSLSPSFCPAAPSSPILSLSLFFSTSNTSPFPPLQIIPSFFLSSLFIFLYFARSLRLSPVVAVSRSFSLILYLILSLHFSLILSLIASLPSPNILSSSLPTPYFSSSLPYSFMSYNMVRS